MATIAIQPDGSTMERRISFPDRGQLTLCQLWSHWSAEPAFRYRCRMVILDHPGCDEAARRKVSFQDDHPSGPGQATSATRRPSRIKT
jgi:hypothetical protein